MPKVIIYHNPRCGQSRGAKALLEEHGLLPKTIEYLQTPPTVTELKEILKLLKISPRDLMRQKESEYKTLGLDSPLKSDAELIKAMHDHPILMQRPIVIIGKKACIARPPETLLDILP